jgi:hypothetical protein
MPKFDAHRSKGGNGEGEGEAGQKGRRSRSERYKPAQRRLDMPGDSRL